MKQLTDEVFAQVRKALLEATIYVEVEGSIEHSKDHQAAIAALDTAQPVPANEHRLSLSYQIRRAIKAEDALQVAQTEIENLNGLLNATYVDPTGKSGLSALLKKVFWPSKLDKEILELVASQAIELEELGKEVTCIPDMREEIVYLKAQIAAKQAQPEPIGTPEQAARFLAKSLKPGEIGGVKRNERLRELMRWFDRFLDGNANPKWFRDHAYELAYAIATQPVKQAQPEPSEMTTERESYIAGLESRTHEMRKKIEQLDYELRVARSSQEKATYTPPKIIDPDAPHPCFN